MGRHASGVNAGGVRRLERHPAEIPLSVAAMELWWRIGELVGADCGFHATGQVLVAENEAEMQGLEERERMVRGLGFDHEELIDRDELYRLVPALAPHCVGGLISRKDGFAHPMETVHAFRRKAESLGVRVFQETRVEAVERTADGWRAVTPRGAFEAPVLVNCAGAWADTFAAALGEPVPLELMAPMMMVTLPVPPFVEPVVLAAVRRLSFKQQPNGTVLIGGGHRARGDRETETSVLDFAKLALSARIVVEMFPLLKDTRVVRAWAGLEGRLPDEIPVIGPSLKAPGVFHAFGFTGHGFQLGPIVGRILADLITEGRTDLPIEPFRIDRFG